jgi:hypothetical protein
MRSTALVIIERVSTTGLDRPVFSLGLEPNRYVGFVEPPKPARRFPDARASPITLRA